MSEKKSNRMPGGIPYIIGNEAAERFSFYGMKAILLIFMTDYLLMSQSDASDWTHTFIIGVYAFPIIGALLSDIFFGKYRIIIWLSLVYCLGHAVLALGDLEFMHNILSPKAALATGLGLIAIGSGGIKPCVSAHVGDQFDFGNSHLLEKVYSYFYLSINLGAFLSTLLIPLILRNYGPALAFGIPGILMFVATILFWMGRHKYIAIRPFRNNIWDDLKGFKLVKAILPFLSLFSFALIPTTASGSYMPAWVGYFLPVFFALMAVLVWALQKAGSLPKVSYKNEFLNDAFSKKGVKAILTLLVLNIFVGVFWSLFDQNSTTWVLQAQSDLMDKNLFGYMLDPAQIQAANPLLILIFTPIFTFILYPFINKFFKLTMLRKIAIGLFITALSFVIVGYAEGFIFNGESVSVGWQFFAFMILTAAEVMVSITGLEFAYTQAPNTMKSLILGFWLLAVSFGSIIVKVVNKMIILPLALATISPGATTEVQFSDVSEFTVGEKINLSGENGLQYIRTFLDRKANVKKQDTVALTGTFVVGSINAGKNSVVLEDIHRNGIKSMGSFKKGKGLGANRFAMSGPRYFYTFAIMMFLTALLFSFISRFYKEESYIQSKEDIE